MSRKPYKIDKELYIFLAGVIIVAATVGCFTILNHYIDDELIVIGSTVLFYVTAFILLGYFTSRKLND